MAHVIMRPGWTLPEREATLESVYWNRREVLRSLGLGILGVGVGGCGSSFTANEPSGEIDTSCDANPPRNPLQTICPSPTADLYPARRNGKYRLDRPETDRILASTHNNFYEFIGRPGNVNFIWDLVGPFQVRPWTITVSGEVENPGTWDVADLEREFGLEDRLYRHRCVERWSMAVPWTGYPLSKLVDKASPLSTANYIRFVSFDRPGEAVGQRLQTWYSWPFYEALRMDEALNELAFVATGIYGEPLPKQNGAPIRLVIPWKYGFKSAKSFVKVEFLRDRPTTFWSDFAPNEFGFYSNVNPTVAHPRWSQVEEFALGEFAPRKTLLFNGYGQFVADLYDPELLTYIS